MSVSVLADVDKAIHSLQLYEAQFFLPPDQACTALLADVDQDVHHRDTEVGCACLHVWGGLGEPLYLPLCAQE